MMLDWHLTILSYCTLFVNHAVMGDEEFEKRQKFYFYAPWQYPKEVHKALKQLDKLHINKKKCINSGIGQKITLVDFFIFNEIMILNLIGHKLEKYPNVVLYMKRMSVQYPELLDVNKSIEAYTHLKKQEFYLEPSYNPSAANL